MPIDDPIAWWKLDDGSGTTAVDSSGNGYDLTLFNTPTWITPAQIAGGLNFAAAGSEKGETSAAGLLASLQGSSTFTVAFWARAAAYQADAAAFAIRNQTEVGELLLIYPYDANAGDGVRVFWNLNQDINQNAGAALVDTWNHFVFVSRSATDHEMFVNNISVGTSTANLSLSGTLSHVDIGAWNGGQFFSGDMDDVRIYNRALTAGEITELFAFDGSVPQEFVGNDADGGSSPHGRRQQPARPYWWHSYFAQWLDEFEEEERKLREKRAKQKAAEAEKREAEALVKIGRQRELIRLQAEYDRLEREAKAAAVSMAVRGARDANEAERAALQARAGAALARVETRKQQAQAELDAEELRELRQIARSPHRRFEQRFKAAIEGARRQGWRAKLN